MGSGYSGLRDADPGLVIIQNFEVHTKVVRWF